MADVKISALPAATTPLTGAEVLPIVQSSTTKQVAVSNLTAGLAGTASININGTVGATTPTTGAFTTLGVTQNLGVGSYGDFTHREVNGGAQYTDAMRVVATNDGDATGIFILGKELAAGTQSGFLWFGGTNGTDQINLGGIGIAGNTTTPGAETGSVVIYTKPAAGAISTVANFSSTGAVTIPGTLGVTGAGFTFSGAGLGNFGTTTSGAGIGTTLQSFTFDSSTASGASPHDICATFKNDTAAGQTLILWNAVNSGDPSWIKFYTEPTGSASLRGSINYNRSAGLTAYNTTSDYRSKDIAGPLENTGEAIDKLKVYLGTMKGATIARPMMIAHEAQEIAPYAVTGTKDQVDKNGEPEFQQMDHQSFVPLLLAEIQSLRARLAALESK